MVCVLMNMEQCTYVDLVVSSRQCLESGSQRDAVDGDAVWRKRRDGAIWMQLQDLKDESSSNGA